MDSKDHRCLAAVHRLLLLWRTRPLASVLLACCAMGSFLAAALGPGGEGWVGGLAGARWASGTLLLQLVLVTLGSVWWTSFFEPTLRGILPLAGGLWPLAVGLVAGLGWLLCPGSRVSPAMAAAASLMLGSWCWTLWILPVGRLNPPGRLFLLCSVVMVLGLVLPLANPLWELLEPGQRSLLLCLSPSVYIHRTVGPLDPIRLPPLYELSVLGVIELRYLSWWIPAALWPAAALILRSVIRDSRA